MGETPSSLPKPQTKLCQPPQTPNNQETLPLSRETLTPTQSISFKPMPNSCHWLATSKNQETLPLLRETETLLSLPKPQTKLCQLPQTLNNQETLPLSREAVDSTLIQTKLTQKSANGLN